MVDHSIEQIQEKLFAYYAENCSDEKEVYQVLGFAEWDDYHTVYNQIWTPEFRYRLYVLRNPSTTTEEAFLAGWQSGWVLGFDSGYDCALEDLGNGIAV